MLRIKVLVKLFGAIVTLFLLALIILAMLQI
jgi:hypothetical protein